MFDMTGYVELKRLLAKVQAIEEKFMPNEPESCAVSRRSMSSR